VDTFILSNEGGGLISQLVTAGLWRLQPLSNLGGNTGDTKPERCGVLTDQFLVALQSNPASSAIFTHTLSEYTASGQSVAISTDGTAQS